MEPMKRLGCAIVLAAIPGLCLAGTDSGFYLGGSVGQAGIDVDFDDVDIDYDDDDSAYKVFLGYNFGMLPMVDLAIEGSYKDFGESSGSILGVNYNTEVTAWDVFGVAGVAFGPVGVFGKIGAVSWESELDSAVDDFDEDGTDPAYGIGAKMQFGSIQVRAEYEYFDIDETEVDFWSVGAAWVF